MSAWYILILFSCIHFHYQVFITPVCFTTKILCCAWDAIVLSAIFTELIISSVVLIMKWNSFEDSGFPGCDALALGPTRQILPYSPNQFQVLEKKSCAVDMSISDQATISVSSYNAANWYCASQHCSRITCTKSPSFCMTTFSTSLTNLTVLLSQSHKCSYYIVRRIQHTYCSVCRNSDLRAHYFSHSAELWY